MVYDLVIIGFGVSGIAAAKVAKKNKLNFVVIESKETYGGCWNDTFDDTELQSDRHYYQFEDFPMPDSYPTYPNKKQILKYLGNVIARFNLTNTIYSSDVTSTVFDKVENRWNIVINRSLKIISKYIIVCSGYYSRNIIPPVFDKLGKIENKNDKKDKYDNFEIVHSRDVSSILKTNGGYFDNKNVVIVGNGASCCDILANINKKPSKISVIYRSNKYYVDKYIFGISISIVINRFCLQFFRYIPLKLYKLLFLFANYIFIMNHLNLPDSKINSKNLIGTTIIPRLIKSRRIEYIHGEITDISGRDIAVKIIGKEEKQVILIKDVKNIKEIDIVILATGFSANLEFIDNSKKSNNLNIFNIFRYKQVINPYVPNCGFIGLSPSYNWLQMSNKQAEWYITEIILKPGNINSNNINMLKEILRYKKMKDSYNLDYNDLTYEMFDSV
tara:strand:- start:64 stop:1395 length:1332 start_codon:yes stop_codon:yes gene_type:complete